MKYRKKPVVIEAFQWTKHSEQDPASWPQWLRDASELDSTEEGALFQNRTGCALGANPKTTIHTLEGDHVVSEGDWIIQGVHGELYPCKPDIFAETYEEAEHGDLEETT